MDATAAGVGFGPRPWAVSRRAVLRRPAEAGTVFVALAAGGCSRVGTSAVPAGAPPVTFEVGDGWLGDIPGLLQGYTRANPRVRFWLQPSGMTDTVPAPSPFVVMSTKAHQFPNSYLTYLKGFSSWNLVPLESTLKSPNFDPASLLPGLIDGFRYGGRLYALPTYLAPAVSGHVIDPPEAKKTSRN